MTATTRDTHIRAILEFYKCGYITTDEKDELIAQLFRAWHSKAKLFDASTIVEGRTLHYLYIIKGSYIGLYVNDDFCVKYDTEKCSFTVTLITKDN